ncbi:protein MpABCC8 [Marchantia polymorpha subsp. ruderalis]|uniref:Uncharacterized protein n=2 Tax=Marchantia polymorpha TaxID=3197 RepID=A0AAF6BE31_MARPO|nr:hypothetical protein MARPO_0147s0016 [Marchantia polymorpha]PTQ29126.1 hypothetical protein MARPO_0147s0016 [Marchantia polymorpha]BBN10264.1 hypothetical protein Mp_5g02230 [Marchantia polymorpha subsp. ruderalis]BBN10265.1 hypothetical protein Mp_5g02230 [Marchantia polymorpha subsp. ruderalis]|eukprot:PTQ29125.1 hypothetical protein MARPO_0147s0016 [Marchantia polymorpha]
MNGLHQPLLIHDDGEDDALLDQEHETPQESSSHRNGSLQEPLLQYDEYIDKSLRDAPVTDFAKAGFFSRLFIYWLSSLLDKGWKKSLVKEDVPLLVPEDRASKLYDDFSANWPKVQEPNSVRRTLARTFWKPFVRIGVIALLRLSVMFVGPVLIQSFVKVTSGEAAFKYEGYVLVLALFLAKSTEVISSHQYNFQCSRLGMKVRSALISTVYRKGIRISSYARQSHGVGQIVNYMSVDVQQMNDVVIQLHNIWIVPGQVILALCILFYFVGVATVPGLLVMCFTTALTLWGAKWLKAYQGAVMKGRDSRMRATVEALSNMKIIKLQAWDKKFQDNVESSRLAEYKAVSGYMYITAFNIFTLWLTPLAACVAIFSCMVIMGGGLTASVAFTTIATVRILQEPLRVFPQTLISLSQASISLGRLERFMWSDELRAGSIERIPHAEDTAISVVNGTFKWSDDMEEPNLQDINLQVPRGSLVAIVGKVGAGKTSILSAVLGEMPKVSGTVRISGSTAYVAQQAWIQNGTIEENILFGRSMNRALYQRVIKKCALETDLAQMEFGDQTEIGERGVNLSGGQKQRIQLARAVYQDCDIYLLDDVFSAVDAHTGSELFRECIVGALHGKTVVLVTHQVEFLPVADQILVMRDGRIVQQGKYDDLLTGGTDFELLVEANNEAMEKVTSHEIVPEEPELPPAPARRISMDGTARRISMDGTARRISMDGNARRISIDGTSRRISMDGAPKSPILADDQGDREFYLPPPPMVGSPVPRGAFELPSQDTMARHSMERHITRKFSEQEVRAEKAQGSARLIQEEERETGKVGFAVYWMYFTRSYRGLLLLLLLIVQVIWQVLQIGGDYWVAYGSSDKELDDQQAKQFIFVYGVLALSCGVFVLFRTLLVAVMGLTTAQSFYLGMLRCMFRAPMSFFDTTPTGRILSRSSTDQASTDVMVPMFSGAVLAIGFQLLGVIFVTVKTTKEILILLLPLAIIYYKYQTYYFATSRELTRVDALTKAPIIHHFSESVSGFVTIRCFGQQSRFIQLNVDRIDSNLRMDFHSQAATEWVGLRMELMGIFILCISSLVLVALPLGFIKPELVGLSLTYGMNLNGSLFVAAWMFCNLENKMVSIERIGQYTKLPHEAELEIEETKPAANWPTTGTIVMKNLKLRYRPQTPLVLKGISITVEGGSKVGVVGRTGSGKSTLILALFRIVEAAEGQTIIDGIDISTLGLNDLRSRLSIIPQDPTLFDGTVRSNLDPLEKHTDEEIWEALEKCQLGATVRQLTHKLDSAVLENGENWSLGQRQLFCLGRVLLKRSRILVLDEATASVDSQTDAVMQKIIRKEFDDCTVISIAHRIPTVMDADKVLVLDAGRVKEYGSPSSLLDDSHSEFSSLVREYSARSVSYVDLGSLDSPSS